MTVRVTYDLFCDNCGNWEHGFVKTINTPGKHAANLRGRYKKEGWGRLQVQVDGSLIDLCPKCYEELTKK